MKSVSIGNARANLAQIVAGAQRGTTTVITRRGQSVAVVAPVPARRRSTMPDLAEFRDSLRVKGKPLSKIIAAHRRGARY